MDVTGYQRWRVQQQVIMPTQPIDPGSGMDRRGIIRATGAQIPDGLLQYRSRAGADDSHRISAAADVDGPATCDVTGPFRFNANKNLVMGFAA